MWRNPLPDFRWSKFGCYLAGGSVEISDFGADVNNCAPLNYSVFMRQVQLGQGTISGTITVLPCVTMKSNNVNESLMHMTNAK